MNDTRRQQTGFTLVELLIVITIIGLIAGFGLTKLMAAKDDAYLEGARDDLRQIHFHLSRYEEKSRSKRLPTEPGSEMVMAIWGRPYLDQTLNNSDIFFDPSLPYPPRSEETIADDVNADTIHWAGRIQDDRKFAISRTSVRDGSKKILVCNKPLVEGEMPHGGNYLAVLYANGAVGEVSRDDFGQDLGDDEPMLIGPESPYEPLQGLAGSPGDEGY